MSNSLKKAACEIGKNSVVKKLREANLISDTCTGVDNAIKQLKKRTNIKNEEIEYIINEIFHTGVEAGFRRAIKRIQDGTITVRKMRNEHYWYTDCNTSSFSVTEEFTIEGKEFKVQTKVKMKDLGFE